MRIQIEGSEARQSQQECGEILPYGRWGCVVEGSVGPGLANSGGRRRRVHGAGVESVIARRIPVGKRGLPVLASIAPHLQGVITMNDYDVSEELIAVIGIVVVAVISQALKAA